MDDFSLQKGFQKRMNSLFVDEREAAKPPRFKPAAILALLSLAAVVAAVLIFAALAE